MRRPTVRTLVRTAFVLSIAMGATACDDQTGPRWVESLGIDRTRVTLDPGETFTLGITIFDQNNQPYDELFDWIDWEITDSSVVRLEIGDGTVRVHGLEPGNAIVRGELGKGKDEVRVEVREGG